MKKRKTVLKRYRIFQKYFCKVPKWNDKVQVRMVVPQGISSG
jgi:hypothetical protein